MGFFSRPATTVFAILSIAAAVAAHGGAMDALERVGSALRAADAWQAAYQQEYIAAGMSAGESVTGTVTAAWPDRARFRTGQPVTQMMGLEGRLVRLVDLEVGSCDEHRLSDQEWSRIPLAAVLDPATALDHFTVVEHGDRGFALMPREPGGVQRVEVRLGEDDLPAEVVIVDPQGATNRLRFQSWRPVDPPPTGGWLPEPPPGVDCVTDEP